MTIKKFPEDFFYFGGPQAKQMDDAFIQKSVNKVKKALKAQAKLTPEDHSVVYEACENAIVIGFRDEDKRTILVCRNYFELDYAFTE